jgi:uncharacterized protein
MPHLKIALLSLALAAPLASAASFNCTKASSAVEKMVCANLQLSRQDDYLNGSFQRALKRVGNEQALRQSQRMWLKSHALNDCKSVECVKLAYGTRVKLLDDAVKSPWNGHYVRVFQGKADKNVSEIVLIGSTEGGVNGEGNTLWIGPNAANGQINVGQFAATGALKGGKLVFVDGECQVTAGLKAAALLVEDNNKCGGVNANFSGTFRRK